ncbi:putative tripeptidyl-peptidase II [Dioscorea sansibarensis]
MLNATLAKGKVILCVSLTKEDSIENAATSASEAGAIGIIFAQTQNSMLYPCDAIPCIKVTYEVGTQILTYIRRTKSPVVKLGHPKTVNGKWVAPRIAYFSSRGPSSFSPAVLKPDIAAPGVNILAAHSDPKNSDDRFIFLSGTSMACPHVSGVAALIKSVHREWSPAAVRSALITTASQTGTDGEPIINEDGTRKQADPFDFGGGHMDPTRVAHPGLIYNMSSEDYIPFLCSMGHKTTAIRNLVQHKTHCPKTSSALDLNLPSIVIPDLKRTVTVSRVVTNVGPVNSVYKAHVSPPNGIKVQVIPNTLSFNSTIKSLKFKVVFSSNTEVHKDYSFGSLTWTDGAHNVRSPIAVRAILFDSYADM